MISVGVNIKIQKHIKAKKGYFWNHAKCSCQNGKHARIIGNSVVAWNKIIEETKTIPTEYFNKFLHLTSFFIDYLSIIDIC